MNKAVRLTLILCMTAAVPAWGAGGDDEDAPKPVSVKTKRKSIGSHALPHLIELALEHAPNVRKAKNALELAELNMRNARVAFYPSLDLDATHGYRDSHPTSNSPWTPYGSGLNLNLSENLYDNGASFTNLKIANAAYEQARLDYELQRDQQLSNVAQAYLDWSASLQQREIDENKRDLLHRQGAILEAQYKQGLKTKRDVLRIETEIRRQEMAIVTRDNEVDLGFQRLASATGLTRGELDREEIEGEEAKPYAGPEEKNGELRVEEHRKAKSLALANRQAELKVRLAEREDAPRLNLTGAAGYHLAGYLGVDRPLYQDTVFDWSALVVIKYNLFDWGQRRRNVEIARVTAQNVAEDNRQQLLDLSNDLRDITNKLREYREDVRMTRELLALEQQSYALLETEYRNGRVNYLDMIGALNSRIDAQSRFVAAYFGLKKEQLLYAFHKGVLSEALK